jgi:hypothetical protein
LEEGNASKNSGNWLAQLIAGGDPTIKLLTLALVLITGGSNIWQTKSSASNTDSELAQAIREIHAIHAVLDSNQDRQKRIEQMLKDLKEKKDGS